MITQFVGLAPKMYSYEITTPDGNEKYKTKAKGYTIDGVTSQIINFKTMKQLVLDGLNNARNEKGLTAERRDDNVTEDFKKTYISDKGIELRKQVKVIKNREIRFEKNCKKFNFNWKNDKRIIIIESDDKHIKTNPVN